VPRDQFEVISYHKNYFDSDVRHRQGGCGMSLGAQNRSEDAKTPSASSGMSKKPVLGRCPIQPYGVRLVGRAALEIDCCGRDPPAPPPLPKRATRATDQGRAAVEAKARDAVSAAIDAGVSTGPCKPRSRSGPSTQHPAYMGYGRHEHELRAVIGHRPMAVDGFSSTAPS
jgi:hypothetical protein